MEEFEETIAYGLKNKISGLYIALQKSNDFKEIFEKRDELLEELNSNEFKNYIEGFGKTSLGIQRKTPNTFWFNRVQELMEYKNNISRKLKIWKISQRDFPPKNLLNNLESLDTSFSILAVNEPELNNFYRNN